MQKHKETNALSNVSLHVPAGKIFGVIGASGAGKSTLIRCVNLLEQPSAGSVIVDGQDLLKLSRAQLALARRNIGMIFQHFNLLSSRTVFENIAFPLELAHAPKTEIDRRVNELLALVGLNDKAHVYPANLSGGQKQRVAIARTLATNPKVLLCDEATSALDPATTLAILALLKDINKRLGITILLITHEMNVVKAICDEVAILGKGVIVEQGLVSTVLAQPKTDLAREFLNASSAVSIPLELENRLSKTPAPGKHPLLKLTFTGQAADSPIISEVAKRYQVENNIISAQLEQVGGLKFGVMLIEVLASAEDSEKAMLHYQQHQIATEVLGYV